MQTQYNHYSDEELLGFKNLITTDPDLIEEIWQRLSAKIKLNNYMGKIEAQVNEVSHLIDKTSIDELYPEIYSAFETLEMMV